MNQTKRYANILFVVTSLFWFSQYAYTSYVNPELEKMGVTAVFMGFVSGSYGFTQLVLRIPVGILSDKWRKKFFISAGCFCAGLSSLIMLLFQHPAAFLIGRALAGVASSSWVTFTILYSSYFTAKKASGSITMLNAANQLGRLFSFICAGVFVSKFGASAAFLIASIGGFAAFILSLLVQEDSSAANNAVSIRELLSVARDRHLLITSILAILIQLISFSTYFSFTSNYAVSINASQPQLSFMNIMLTVPCLAANFLVSRLIQVRAREKWIVFTGFLLTAAYCILLPSAATILQLYILQILAGIGNAFSLSVLMGMCIQNIPVNKRSAAMGFFQALYGIGMTVGPIIMGFITDYAGLAAGFYIMALLSGVSAAATIFAFHKPSAVQA